MLRWFPGDNPLASVLDSRTRHGCQKCWQVSHLLHNGCLGPLWSSCLCRQCERAGVVCSIKEVVHEIQASLDTSHCCMQPVSLLSQAGLKQIIYLFILILKDSSMIVHLDISNSQLYIKTREHFLNNIHHSKFILWYIINLGERMNQFQETFLVFSHSENKILVHVLSVWTKCVLKRLLPSVEWWGHCLQLPCTKTSPWSNLSSDLSSNKENIQEDSDFLLPSWF